MKVKLLHTVALAVGLAASAAQAQVVLNDFSNYVKTDQTFFNGDWSAGGDPATPAASFVQNSGTFDFAGGTNSDASGTIFYFTPLGDPIDLTGATGLAFTAGLLPDNQAGSFTIALLTLDPSSYASATFNTADFSSSSYQTVSSGLTAFGGFDLSQVVAFQISGSIGGGTDLLNISADNLATVTAVPEPGTYAALAGAAALGLAFWRRRRAAA